MKRLLVLLLLVGLVAGSITTAEAAKKKKKKKKNAKVTRSAVGTYSAPATAVGNCTQTDGVGCMTIASGPKEKYLTAEVTDQTGQPVVIEVSADLDGDIQTETTYGTFCGKTSEPIKIDPGAAIVFWVGRADTAALAGCVPGVGTQGTLNVKFSNKP
jgi:hypothetical protein